MVPLANLSAQYSKIKKEIDKRLERVLKSGKFVLGQEVEDFEKNFAKFIGTEYAVGLASGTDALTLALKSLGLGPGDGVVLAANVYPTAFGAALSGVNLQLADVDPKTLNLSLDSLKKTVNKKTKAVILVHLYGNPANLSGIVSFCRKKKIYLIEDCAQAHGAIYKGKKVGTFGQISCFSFYPTKNLGAYGDGGAVLTNSKKLAEKARLLRMYGEESRYKSLLIGHNSRLDELQAAILNVKLKYLSSWNLKRRKLAKLYERELRNLPIRILDQEKTAKAVYHLFVVLVEKRDELAEFLAKNGVATGIHYPVAIHMTLAFKSMGFREGDFPVSEEASKKALSLPLYPEMAKEDLEKVTSLIKKFYDKRK